MPKAKRSKNDPLGDLPAWAQKLAQRYSTRTVSTFLVYGAVRDLQPVTSEDGTRGFGNLEDKVNQRSREDVYTFDLSTNIDAGKLLPKK